MDSHPSMAETLLNVGNVAYQARTDNCTADVLEARGRLRTMMNILVAELRAGGIVPHEDLDAFVFGLAAERPSEETIVLAALIAPFVSDEMLNLAGAAAGINPIEETLHPKFLEAGQALNRIMAEEGKEAIYKPEHFHWFAQLLQYAPDHFSERVGQDAEELGLMPKATHVNERGEPVYSIQQIAEAVGQPVEDVQRLADEHLPAHYRAHGQIFPLQ